MQKDNWLPSSTVLYLLFPLILFVYGWLKEPIAVFLSFLLLVLFVFLVRELYLSFRQAYYEYLNPSWKADLHSGILKWGIAFVILLVWVLLSGTGGFGYQNADYVASNALLKELIDQPWPLTIQWNGVSVPIVYYVGWYLPAAQVGKIFGWPAGNIFSLLWTYLGLCLSFLWFLRAGAIKNLNAARMLVVLIVFCLADGLDLVMLNSIGWDFFQYSAQTTLIYWVPQHTVSAWLVTGLIVDCIYGRLSTLKYLGVGLATCIISSPFGVIGTLPYLVVILVINWRGERRRAMFSLQSILYNVIAIPFGLIGLFYLSSNKFSFPKGFLWEFIHSPLLFIGWLEFCLIEFGFLSIFVFSGLWLDYSRHIRKLGSANKPTFQDYLEKVHAIDHVSYMLFVTSVLVLLLLPLYRMGYRDDLLMRGSIPSLFIFWAFISKILVNSGLNRNPQLRPFYRVIICLTLIGFYISLVQIFQSATHYHFGPPDKNSVLPVAFANPPRIVEQRIGNHGTLFYRYFGK